MPSYSARDFLLKIGDGEDPENFTTIGAARTLSMVINNQTVDDTDFNDNGFQSLNTLAGVQSMHIQIDGLFKDSDAEKALRAQAMTRTSNNYILCFPNGDTYTAGFVIEQYSQLGDVNDLEQFQASLIRTGEGTYTTAEA